MSARSPSPGKLISALAMLALGGWYSIVSIMGEFGTSSGEVEQVSPEDLALDGEFSEQDTQSDGVDLLAVVGSCDLSTAIPNPFLFEARLTPAAPGGAATAVATHREAPRVASSAAPPEMTISLVLRVGRSQRAVVDGQVIGIGDRVAAGIVKRITDAGIGVEMTGGRTWFYTLKSRLPLGYAPPPDSSLDSEQPREDRKQQ